MDSLALQTIIGIVFVFAVFALLVSTLTEAGARFIGLRGEYLLRGIRSLVDNGHDFKMSIWPMFGAAPAQPDTAQPDTAQPDTAQPDTAQPGTAQPGTAQPDTAQPDTAQPDTAQPDTAQPDTNMTTTLMTETLLRSRADKASPPQGAGSKPLSNSERRKLPSYISGRSFAQAILDTVIPDSGGNTAVSDIRKYLDTPSNSVAGTPLAAFLNSLAKTVDDDMAAFRKGIENWYDDQMSRVSGWYKRHTRWISLGVGLILVLTFNVNAITITRALYTDQALRESVVTQAVAASNCGDKNPKDCLGQIHDEISAAATAGIPIGWAVPAPCQLQGSDCSGLDQVGVTDPQHSGWADLLYLVLVALGWAVMVLVLLPGARFWFDLLGRLGSLRSAGAKPPIS